MSELSDRVLDVQRQLAQQQAALIARRPPTGTIEPRALLDDEDRLVSGGDTLVLDGSQVSRADYAALWSWVLDNDLVRPGLFRDGDGATTFVLPDLRGRADAAELAPGRVRVHFLIWT